MDSKAANDPHSRFVLSWRLSNTMTTDFCLDAVEEAFDRFGVCKIFNTDQGSQFTSEQFTGLILGSGASLSMDGKGRSLDNVFVERLWRSVKYEHLYLVEYRDGREMTAGLGEYFRFYNGGRGHSSLGMLTPKQVFLGNFKILP